MTAIIILNWNGSRDTIACLDSLFAASRQDFLWVVTDNGSSDNSLVQIATFLQQRQKPFITLRENEDSHQTWQVGQGIVCALRENHGFAKGNNLAIAMAEKTCRENRVELPSHYLLLNNDTLVEPDFLLRLETFAQTHPEYVALTPQIRYAEPRDLVWNCGGKMPFGLRMYHYYQKPCSQVKRCEFFPISLITGCALFVSRSLLGQPDKKLREKSKRYAEQPLSPTDATDLLSNRFFFGEEDFDFSLRMKEQKKKMACVPGAVIYHKSGSSRKDFVGMGVLYMHHLNRFIDIRQHWSAFKFFAVKMMYVPYIVFVLILREKIKVGKALCYVRHLWWDSLRMDGMNKEVFQKLTQAKNTFPVCLS